ncbi:MAG: hypothetical protein ACRDZU_10405 [Acidimicrobiales bacterium]
MALESAMGGRPVLRVLAVGGDDLRLALLPHPATGGGLADLVLARHGSVRVDIDHVDVPPMPELVSLLRAGASGVAGAILADDLDVVVLSLMPHLDCSPPELASGITELVAGIRAASGAHVLIANCCTYGASDDAGANEQMSPLQRLRWFNLALMELSSELAISIVDADRRITELGARRVAPRPFEYSDEGRAALCDEMERVLADYGYFEARPLMAQVPREPA